MKQLTTLLTAMTLAISSSANAAPPKPAKCPNPAAIYRSPFTLIDARIEGTTWTVLGNRDNTYGTANHWYFIVTQIQAFTREKAFEYAAASLASLGNPSGPIYSETLARWGCMYVTAQGYYAYTITPL